MQLRAQEEYGLRCLIRVAKHPGPKLMTVSEVARAEGITPAHAGKLMQLLRSAELLASVPGRAGGYRLARPATAISLWEGIQALGGPLFTEDFCVWHTGRRRKCAHSTNCSLRPVWDAVNSTVRELLEQVALADLLRSESAMADWLETEFGEAG
jgi:Rrf2 family protein